MAKKNKSTKSLVWTRTTLADVIGEFNYVPDRPPAIDWSNFPVADVRDRNPTVLWLDDESVLVVISNATGEYDDHGGEVRVGTVEVTLLEPSVYVGRLYTDDDVQEALNALSDRQIAILGLTHLKRS